MDFMQVLWTSVDCDGIGVVIPGQIAYLVSIIVKLLQFGVPLLLIIFGMLDLGKAVIASKEDEIKKGQQMFVHRLITAVIIFFIVAVVKLVVNIASANSSSETGEESSISSCIQKIIDYKG